MYLKSRFPSLPSIPDSNVHNLMFNAPGQAESPIYDLYVDGVTGRKRTSYEFREFVRDAASALGAPESAGGLNLSPERGHMVGMFAHNCLDFPVLFHALLVLTTPVVLLSAYSTVYELRHGLRTGKITHLFVQPPLLPTALAAAKEVGLSENRIFIIDGPGHAHHVSLLDLTARFKYQGVARMPVRSAKKDTLAYLVFSSGTTGLPKAVMVSHGNIWAIIMMQVLYKQTEDKLTGAKPPPRPPVALQFLPMYHAYCLHVACLRLFFAPLTIVLMPKWDATAVLKAIPKYRVNVLSLVPSAVHQLINHPAFNDTDLTSLQAVGCGAAYLPPALKEKFEQRLGGSFTMGQAYGMSEQTLGIARKPVNGLFGLRVPKDTVGLILSGVEARLLHDDGCDVDVDEPGELWVRAPCVVPGYYGNEQATKETFVDGWLRTGDTLKADKDGFLFFVERKKDTLKVSGVQVSPTEIEDVLRAHPDKLITDVCVGGVSGGRTSDEKNPRAWIVLSEEGRRRGAAETVEALDKWAKQNLSSYKWLRGGFEVIDAVPKSPTGKVLRRSLQDAHEKRQASKARL